MVTLGISPITLGSAELHLPTEDLSISDTTSFPSDHELRCATHSRRSGQRCVCNALSPMFYLPTSLHGFPCSALLDSGASDNFISDSLVTQLNLHRHPLHINLHFRTANGERLPCTHYVRARLFLPTFSFRVCFRIAPITPQLILGCPFLERFNPDINWHTRTMSLHFRDQIHTVHVDSYISPSRVHLLEDHPPQHLIADPLCQSLTLSTRQTMITQPWQISLTLIPIPSLIQLYNPQVPQYLQSPLTCRSS